MKTLQTALFLLVIGLLGTQTSFAQVNDSIYGTHSVVFQPLQESGALFGCSLVYSAIHADHAYRHGRPIIINGNISVQRFAAGEVVGLKIGVTDFTETTRTRPYFAYMQTPVATTANIPHQKSDGDVEGFLLIGMGLNEASMNFLAKMLELGEVTIGFNYKEGGMDVLVPIDLKVFDVEPLPSERFHRKRSFDALQNFSGCFAEILKQGLSRQQK
ncbi:MAG: hypothetical protein ACSLFL_12545 [Alphaproteobacteria bacterium]